MIWFILFIAGCYALTVRWIVGEISAAGRDGQSVERSGSSGASPRRFLISPFLWESSHRVASVELVSSRSSARPAQSFQ